MAAQLPEIGFSPDLPLRTGELGALRSWARRHVELELWIPAGLLLLLAAACFLWPLIDSSLPSPIVGNIANANAFPLTPGHIFGTDVYGDDIFSRILYGGRVSLEVGLGTSGIGLVFGGLLGMIAGYRSGVVDVLIMRAMDMLLAFPSLVLALVVAEYLGPSEIHVIWAISFFTVPAFARLSRTTTLRTRELKFVTAARHSGSSDLRILFRHIAPNVMPQLLTFGLLGVALAILFEATLSFLGLGVPPPNPSWGNMINLGESYLSDDPYLVIIPAAFLCFTVICLNLLGDAVRARIAAQ